MRPRALFYCQHVLGMGHFMRSAALIHGLAEEYDVTFLNGGGAVPGVPLPRQVDVVELPPLSMDAEFSELQSSAVTDVAEVQRQRRITILETFEQVQPHVVMLELFPFGRKKFAKELVPLLARIRRRHPDVTVVCSVRDILVSRDHQTRHDERVLRTLNRYFDLVLVHSDERFHALADSFAPVDRIECRVEHTGYVVSPRTTAADTDELAALELDDEHPVIVASIGGGRVGVELLEAVARASAVLHSRLPHTVVLSTGPYLPTDALERLTATVGQHHHMRLVRFVRGFDALLGRADLSISMAGYNTCMNVVGVGVRALVHPFTGGGNDEQTIRAEKLAAAGVLRLVHQDDLDAPNLARLIETALEDDHCPADLALDGVATTVQLLRQVVPAGHEYLDRRRGEHPSPFAELTERLDEVVGGVVDVFLRDDDVGPVDERLLEMLDISLSHGTPINLEIIPSRLTAEAAAMLKDIDRAHPGAIELHQHGWTHQNNEAQGRKCEFGPSRNYAQQLADIAAGKAKLTQLLGERFFPAFTPPWNRCTRVTHQVLDDLGFEVLSKDHTAERPGDGYGFVEVSTTLDLFTWKDGPALRSRSAIADDLIDQVVGGRPIGVLLHHEVMDHDAMDLFDDLLTVLARRTDVRFHTLGSLSARTTRGAALTEVGS